MLTTLFNFLSKTDKRIKRYLLLDNGRNFLFKLSSSCYISNSASIPLALIRCNKPSPLLKMPHFSKLKFHRKHFPQIKYHANLNRQIICSHTNACVFVCLTGVHYLNLFWAIILRPKNLRNIFLDFYRLKNNLKFSVKA